MNKYLSGLIRVIKGLLLPASQPKLIPIKIYKHDLAGKKVPVRRR